MTATGHNLNDWQPCTVATASKRFSHSDQDRRFLYAALGSLLLVRLAAMFALPFVDTTEARYAEIAQIMLETGDWITPQFDYGVLFWGKPPLHSWLSAAGMAVFGVGEFGARVFIGATWLGVVALTFHWVKQGSGKDQALLVCVVLFSTAANLLSAYVLPSLPATTILLVSFWVRNAGDPTRLSRLAFA